MSQCFIWSASLSWRRYDMGTLSVLPVICEGNPPANSSSRYPVLQRFDVFSVVRTRCWRNGRVIIWGNMTLMRPLYCYNETKIMGGIRGVANGHEDVITWKHFPRYWPFVLGIQRSREAGDLRHHHGHYDVMVMTYWNIASIIREKLSSLSKKLSWVPINMERNFSWVWHIAFQIPI